MAIESISIIQEQPEVMCSVRGLYQTLGGTEILHGLDLDIAREFTVINGESGSGKSTLFTCLAGLRKITAGEIIQENVPIHDLDEGALTEWRGANTGIIFQHSNLLDGYNVLDNIVGPRALIDGKVDRDRLVEVTGRLGILDKMQRYPNTLSGGEQQRVAIARAIVHKPAIVFADEPTGKLGTGDTQKVHELLREMVDQDETALVMVSHEDMFKEAHPAYADRIITLSDGQITDDRRA